MHKTAALQQVGIHTAIDSSGETDSTEDQADSSDSHDTDSKVERPRCSQRWKQPPKGLQVDGHCKRYEQHEITVTEIDELSDE